MKLKEAKKRNVEHLKKLEDNVVRLKSFIKSAKGSDERHTELCKRKLKNLRESISYFKKEQSDIDKYEKSLLKESRKKPLKKVLILQCGGSPISQREYPDSDLPSHRMSGTFVSKEGEKVIVSFSAWHRPLVGKKVRYDKKTSAHIEASHDTPCGTYSWRSEEKYVPYTKDGLLEWFNDNSRDHYTSIRFKKL